MTDNWVNVTAEYRNIGLKKKLRERLELWRSTRAKHHVFVGKLQELMIQLWVDTGAPISLVGRKFLEKCPHLRLQPRIPDTLYRGLSNSTDTLHFIGSVVFAMQLGGLVVEIIAGVIEEDLPHGCDILMGNFCLEANHLDFTAPWDSDSMLYERSPY